MVSPVRYIGVDRMTSREPSRLTVIVDTMVRAEGVPDRKVTIGNLSSGGCMAAVAGDMRVGSHVMVMVPGIGWTPTDVRWSEAGRFGGRFVEPISMTEFWRANPPFGESDARPRH